MKNLLHKIKHKIRFINSPAKEQLDVQLKRTLQKKKEVNKRVELLIDKLGEFRHFGPHEKVLFVGCRNPHEILYFKQYHQAGTGGIDLYSESNLIEIMDMHKLSFPDNTFDLVFSSHSLEHSYDPQKAVNEFIRVMKDEAFFVVEVPVNYRVTSADLIDFKDKTAILKLFSGIDTEVIWDRYTKKGEAGNYSGTDVVSLILKVKKYG